MMLASIQSCTTTAMSAANTRISSSGLFRRATTISPRLVPSSSPMVLLPQAARRRAASSVDSPPGPLPRAAAISGAGRDQ